MAHQRSRAPTRLGNAAAAITDGLHPDPLMPWSVRLPHLVEVAVANALFGGLAVVVLMRGQRAGAPESRTATEAAT